MSIISLVMGFTMLVVAQRVRIIIAEIHHRSGGVTLYMPKQ